MAESIVKMVIAVAIAATLVSPFIGAIDGNTGSVDVNESLTADVGNYQDLEGYDIDASTFSANDSDGNTLTDGTDYELNSTDGTVKFTSAGNVGDAELVTANYTYQATDGTTSTIADLLPLFVALLILVTLAAGVTNRL